jgi:hypothetical protein
MGPKATLLAWAWLKSNNFSQSNFMRAIASKVTRFDSTWRFPVGSPKRACLHKQTMHTWWVMGEHPEWDTGGDTRGSGSHLQKHATSCSVYVLTLREDISSTSSTAFHTGGHFQHLLWQPHFIQVWHANANQHFPGLPLSGTHCTIINNKDQRGDRVVAVCAFNKFLSEF